MGCGGGSDDATTTPKAKAVNTLDQNMTEAYQMYVEQALSNRVRAFKLFEDVVGHDPLSGTELDLLHKMLVRYLNNRAETSYYIQTYQHLALERDEEYTEKERFELVMISLSAMLTRYDNYLLAYSKYYDDSKLYDVLNYADSSYAIEDNLYGIPEDTIEDISDLYYLESDREDLIKMINYYTYNLKYFKDDTNTLFVYLRALIEDSPSYQLGLDDEWSLFASIADFYDDISDTVADFFDSVSENIGNTAGLVESRTGKLYGNDEVASNVRTFIQAGDILIERTPFRLTDKLIPGYWGHIAVYIGTENELKEMEIWDDLNTSIQASILEDKGIVEALRDGVQLNTIEHFLNVDDFAIMHDENELQENKIERIKRVALQLGKEYDFEYDIEDNSKIICSELVYITSLNVDWDTSSTIGINTISPDNVAIISTKDDTAFSVPLMYHDGVLVQTDTTEKMKTILEEYEE